ncbi:hypothetical protein ACN3XK_72335 [Actinomadura welshii]
MPAIDDVLSTVGELVRTVRLDEAQAKLTELIENMPPAELRDNENRLRMSIEGFLPKRRRALTGQLEGRMKAPAAPARLAPSPGRAAAPSPPPDVANRSAEGRTIRAVNDKLAEFANSLSLLSQHHIFQWSTHYRQQMSRYFNWFFGVSDSVTLGRDVGQLLSRHSAEIFQKGFQYLEEQGEQEEYAIAKSMNGLQAFLDLPIEFYSAKLPLANDVRTARRLRALTSAMLLGILDGYSEVRFGGVHGGQVLPRRGRGWAHTLAFLTAGDLQTLVEKIETGEFRDGVVRNVVPLVEAMDLLGTGRTHAPYPALSQFLWSRSVRRLEVALRPSSLASDPQLIQIHCNFDFVDRAVLDEADKSNVALVIGPARGDLRTFIDNIRDLERITVFTESDPATTETAREAILSILTFNAYRKGTRTVRSQPLQYNYAREFPLDFPSLTRYNRVYRQSVQDLLRAFDRRNGVRLWCSVRRSGKTTAGFDLGSTTGRSAVITQTCDSTGGSAEDGAFFTGVTDALEAGRRIPPTFLSDLIARCAVSRPGDGDRVVFVLDEYETLFGEFRRFLRIEPDIRYPVIQPLLNQMVKFSADNLLVFMGQQPDAHFILMDQNQLSPYVKQDPFPLFFHEHGDANEEFTQFVARVLAHKVEFEPSFAGGLFRETSGHPFLTVKLLIDLMDWLIESGRPAATLRLTGEDMREFAERRLSRTWINSVKEYDFFRHAAEEAMGSRGRGHTQWLHAVYTCLHRLGRSSPGSLACTRGDFRTIVEEMGGRMEDQADRLLINGKRSNFFDFDDDEVRPRIPLLCRIAAASHPRTDA